jgi:hypothetical protein
LLRSLSKAYQSWSVIRLHLIRAGFADHEMPRATNTDMIQRADSLKKMRNPPRCHASMTVFAGLAVSNVSASPSQRRVMYTINPVVVCTVAWLAGTPVNLPAQVITGRVLELGSDRPVPAVSVTVVAAGRSLFGTEADSVGSFRVAVPGAGWYSLRVGRIGYASVTSDSLEVGPREDVEVTIRLSVEAFRLEPLLVVERREEVRPRSELERRLESGRRSGLGVFITREALDSTTAQTVTALLSRMPFLRLGRDDLPITISRGGCTPTLYLNGARFQLAERLDEFIQPGTLEAVEIYRNESELPREFAGIGHCGAIVFWTRVGEPRRGAAWRFLLAGGALLGMALFFIAN